ncbi:MAG TPA: hypothetical protein VGC91_13450 [Pyrinomonadaceae bacterium]|jgi:rubrerythrin
MTQAKCSCAKFERLEGASVNAYISAFLEQAESNLYRCRVCGSLWERRAPEVKREGGRPSLARVRHSTDG